MAHRYLRPIHVQYNSAGQPEPPGMQTSSSATASSTSYVQVPYYQPGSLSANTYTFTTAGPVYKATIGTCPQNIRAMRSRVQNFADLQDPFCY